MSTFQFTQGQILTIQDLQARGEYALGYQALIDMISDFDHGTGAYLPRPGIDPSALLWLDGATDVNMGLGVFSGFIREYTSQQHEIRYGSPLSNAQLQAASDRVADNVMDDVISSGTFPDIGRIAVHDASGAVQADFGGDFSAWSGAPLFLFFGYDQAYNDHIIPDPANTYSLFTMLRALLDAGTAVAFGSSFDSLLLGMQTVWATVNDNAVGLVGTGDLTQQALGNTLDFLDQAYGGEIGWLSLLLDDLTVGLIQTADTIVGGEEADILIGGAGQDTVSASAGSDFVDAGAGHDVLDYSHYPDSILAHITETQNPSEVPFTGYVMKFPINPLFAGTDTVYNVEEIIATPDNDWFQLDVVKDGLVLDGGEGHDDLIRGFGSQESLIFDVLQGAVTSPAGIMNIRNIEWLEGSDRSDTFILDQSTNKIVGREGEDTVDYSGATAGLILELMDTTAPDAILEGTPPDLTEPNAGGESIDELYGVETVIGSAQNDQFRLHEIKAGMTLDGSSGAEDRLDFLFTETQLEFDGISETVTANGASLAVSGFEAFAGTAYGDILTARGPFLQMDGGFGDDLLYSRADDIVLQGGPSNSAITALVDTYGFDRSELEAIPDNDMLIGRYNKGETFVFTKNGGHDYVDSKGGTASSLDQLVFEGLARDDVIITMGGYEVYDSSEITDVAFKVIETGATVFFANSMNASQYADGGEWTGGLDYEHWQIKFDDRTMTPRQIYDEADGQHIVPEDGSGSADYSDARDSRIHVTSGLDPEYFQAFNADRSAGGLPDLSANPVASSAISALDSEVVESTMVNALGQDLFLSGSTKEQSTGGVFSEPMGCNPLPFDVPIDSILAPGVLSSDGLWH